MTMPYETKQANRLCYSIGYMISIEISYEAIMKSNKILLCNQADTGKNIITKVTCETNQSMT